MKTFEHRTPIDPFFLSKKKPDIDVDPYPYHQLCYFESTTDIEELSVNIEHWNAQHLAYLINAFERVLSGYDTSQFCICITGSHGRREAHPHSEGDVMVIAKEYEIGVRIVQFLQRKPNFLNSLHIDEKMEIKVIGSTSQSVSSFNGDKKQYWPDRLLSAQIIAGSYNIYRKAIEAVVPEFEAERNFRHQLRSQINKYAHLTHDGHDSKGNAHFNRKKGELYYDETQYIKGLKYGPVRLIQAVTTREQLKHHILHTDTSMKKRVHEVHGGECPLAETLYSLMIILYHHQLVQITMDKDQKVVRVNPEILEDIIFSVLQITGHQGSQTE